MIDKQVIANLRPIHGAYGLLVMLLFWFQAYLGFSIRKARREGGANPGAIRRHRRNGPVIAMLVGGGYLFGAVLGYLDNGRLLKYPLHFLNGTAIIITVITTVVISRRLKARDMVLRNFHAALGLLLLCLYALQAFLGIGILF